MNNKSLALLTFLIAIVTLISCSINKVPFTHSHDGKYAHCSICREIISTSNNQEVENKRQKYFKEFNQDTLIVEPVVENTISKQNSRLDMDLNKQLNSDTHKDVQPSKIKDKASENLTSSKIKHTDNQLLDESSTVEKENINAWALAGLIIGISGLLLSFTIVAPFFAGIFGTIFSIIGINKSKRKSTSRIIAIIGFILSLAQLLFFATLIIMLIIYF